MSIEDIGPYDCSVITTKRVDVFAPGYPGSKFLSSYGYMTYAEFLQKEKKRIKKSRVPEIEKRGREVCLTALEYGRINIAKAKKQKGGL